VGPANLSLASLLHERPDVANLFLDKKPAFSWHDDQQLPGTSLQVSMLKDLVSLAEPTNRFSFLAYLHAQGRIYHFVNARFDAVPRQEFRNYLEWAAAGNDNVVFGETVESVEFDRDFVVHTDRRTLRSESLSIGIGTVPWLPPAAEQAGGPGPGNFHVSRFMSEGRDLGGLRVCLVGGGQSGAEAFLDLVSRPPGERPSRVTWVTRRLNFLPMDDSPFTNEFYMPDHSDHYFRLDAARRARFNADHLLSSDGISEATLRLIYQHLYTLRFIKGEHELVSLHRHQQVVGVTPAAIGGWRVKLVDGDSPDGPWELDTDVIVWATGFKPAVADFLAPLHHRLDRDGSELRIDEDFAVVWDGPADRNIFVHNAAQQQRGLPDKNLSLIAWRSQRIVDRLCGTRSPEPVPSFIEWAPRPSGPAGRVAGDDLAVIAPDGPQPGVELVTSYVERGAW
jgi:lysine N6-hydroxylase